MQALCGSRKYPYPHHGGNWKFQRGGGVNGPGNSRGGGGVNGWISFQRVNFTFMSDIVVQNCNLPT